MKHGEKMKRLLAVFLALSMAWSGSTPGSGLSLVEAEENSETTVDESTEATPADSSEEDEQQEEQTQTDEKTEAEEEKNESEVEEEETKTEADLEDEETEEEASDKKASDKKASNKKASDEKALDEEESEEAEEDEEDEDEDKEKDKNKEHKHTYSYTSNCDGTHKVTCQDEDCDYEATEDCVDEDEDGNCDLCEETIKKPKKLLKSSSEAKLIADFNFDEVEADETMTGAGAKASGTYSVTKSYGTSGNALELDGSSQFLTVTKENGDSLLKGLDEVSISADVSFEHTATDWLFFSSDNTQARSESHLN